MIPIKEVIKNKVAIGYEELIKSCDVEIVSSLRMGSYQGDLIMIVKQENKFGLFTTGYGSCSGCDALAAAEENLKKLDNLRNSLYKKIIWKDITQFIKYLREKDWTLEYYYDEEKLPEFIRKKIEGTDEYKTLKGLETPKIDITETEAF